MILVQIKGKEVNEWLNKSLMGANKVKTTRNKCIVR